MLPPQSELTLVSAVGAEPLLLADARLWLRVDTPDEDDLISALITAARQYAETFCRRAFTSGEVWKLSLDHFPYASIRDAAYWNLPVSDLWESDRDYIYTLPEAMAVEIPMGPVSSISSFTYLDGAGTLQALAPSAYTLISGDDQNAKIFPAYGTSWPSTQIYPAAINIQFTTGATNAPAGVVLAMKQMISHWYTNRESVVMQSGVMPQVVPQMSEFLMWPHRLLEL